MVCLPTKTSTIKPQTSTELSSETGSRSLFCGRYNFTIENVMGHLLYAESKNCALLKEASMDYIVENKTEVIEKLSFANAPGEL
jgi:hypothetical protein